MVAWSLWRHRNAVVWKSKHQTPHLVIQSACDLLEQWQKSPKINNVVVYNRREGVTKWKKPQQGWFTCNIDAAVFSENNLSSFGCLLRDEYGSFVAGYGGSFMGDLDPKIAEAMAFREALS